MEKNAHKLNSHMIVSLGIHLRNASAKRVSCKNAGIIGPWAVAKVSVRERDCKMRAQKVRNIVLPVY